MQAAQQDPVNHRACHEPAPGDGTCRQFASRVFDICDCGQPARLIGTQQLDCRFDLSGSLTQSIDCLWPKILIGHALAAVRHDKFQFGYGFTDR